MRWVCVVIMWSLQTRIKKSFSYSISYPYSNLKSSILELPKASKILEKCNKSDVSKQCSFRDCVKGNKQNYHRFHT